MAIEHLTVIRAEFETGCGSASILFAVRSMDQARECVDEYAEKLGYKFSGLSDTCVMTPLLYTPDQGSDKEE